MKTPRGPSESSTTSDNTTEFIDIVKKYDVVYNTHNPDYKNVEVKMKVWSQIAEEIGLSVDASKRKWKNLRDSYTKYLRSFRTGTKTSKKYQYWAHADHMDFLKPYQGPGRHSNGNSNSNSNSNKPNDDEDTECDFGFQVLTKATNSSSDEDIKLNLTAQTTTTTVATMPPNATTTVTSPTVAPTIPTMPVCTSSTASATTMVAPTAPAVNQPQLSPTFSNNFLSSVATAATLTAATSTTCGSSLNSGGASGGAIVLPLPSLPTVTLPPMQPATSKPMLGPISTLPTNMPPAQIFPLPPLPNALKSPFIPANSTASSVGCLIIEPQLFASADTFKKELSAPAIGLFHSITSPATTTTSSSRVNPPLITKIRRVQPSPQTAAINLSFTPTPATTTTAPTQNQPPPSKIRKTNDRDRERERIEVDISAILQANRDLDANTLFFLSLARMVRSMPTKFQSLAKMRCMRIVSDIELELENVNECGGMPSADGHSGKFCSLDSSPSPPDGANIVPSNPVSDGAPTEHFVYVMSPSRVESMIDISSDEEATMNGTN